MAQTDRIAGYVGDIALKLPCRVATTGAITLSGLQTIDGIAVAAGDRVLVKNQASAVENGIYFAATGNWPRTPDFDGARDVVKGTTVSITDGTTLSGFWFEVSSENTNQPGVDALTFAENVSGPAAANAAANSAAAALASEGAAAGSAAASAASAANLPNAPTAGADKYIKSNATADGWSYKTPAEVTAEVVGLTAGKAQQVDQTVAATTRAATTDFTGESLEGTLSDTGIAITAFHGVAGVTYTRKCLGAGKIIAGAGLTILQGGVDITTELNEIVQVYMLTATTSEVRNATNLNSISTIAPTNNIYNGSLGLGLINTVVTRNGGYGQYGNWLSQYLISAAVPVDQFDSGISSWLSATNLTGGQAFGGWDAANTPGGNMLQTYSGGAAIGREINFGNRWADLGLQLDVGGTRWTAGLNIIPDIGPALDGVNTVAVSSISIASPGVITLNAHGFTANMGIVFGGTGTLPDGLVAGDTYFVLATGLTADTFQVSVSIGGAAVNTTGSFVAPITVLPSYPGSFGVVIGRSVHGHQIYVGTLLRYDTICAGGHANIANGGSVTTDAPLDYLHLQGYWTNGIDFSGAAFSNAAIKFSYGQVTGTATAGGGQVLPATIKGYLTIDVGGILQKIPYYNV